MTHLPLFLGAAVGGESASRASVFHISIVRRARGSPPAPASPSGSALFSRSRGPGWGQRPGRLGCGPGCGALAEPAHLAATRAPAAGDRPARREAGQGDSEAAPPVGLSALRLGGVHQRLARQLPAPAPGRTYCEPSLGNRLPPFLTAPSPHDHVGDPPPREAESP